jgi:thiosulfate/3-mercaptopyruvate sulfurtransferase
MKSALTQPESKLNLSRLDATPATRYRSSAVTITRRLPTINVVRSIAVLLLLLVAASGCRNATRNTGPAGTPSDAAAYPDGSLLVSAQWLQAHLTDPSVRIVDLSAIGDYQQGHIPGAVHLWWQDTIELHNEVYGMMAGQPEIHQMVQTAGITPESNVVLYDNAGERWAARFLWVLNANGFTHVSLLNGGRQAWQAGGYGLTRSSPSVTAGHLDLKLNYDVLIDSATVAAHLNDTGYVFVDNRNVAEQQATWYGKLRLGQIPGAKLIPWTAVTEQGSIPYFEAPETLRKLFLDAGVTPDKKIVVYGLDGVSAAQTYVALKLLGYPAVQVYDGSWSQWGSSANLPITPLPDPPASTK